MAKDCIERVVHELQILLYVCALLKLTRPHIKNPLLFAAKASRRNCSKVILKLQRLSLKSFYEKIKPQGVEFDLNSVVVISPKTSIYLGARNCQWVSARFHIRDNEDPPCSGQTQHSRKRWIILYISSEVSDDLCMISPLLYHNIKAENDVELSVEITNEFQYFMSSAFQKVLVLWHNTHIPHSPVKEDVNYQSSPHYAMEVHVKYVESLKYKCGSGIDMLINSYFSLTKTVTLNDLILIPLPSHLVYDFTNSNCIVPPKYVFIKVCSVKGKTGAETQQTMLVKKDVTRLYLSGTVQCSLPCLTASTHSDGKMDIPPVLANGFDKFKSIMEMGKKDKEKKACGIDINSYVCAGCKETEFSNSCTSDNTRTKDQVPPDFTNDYDAKDQTKLVSSVLFLGPPGNGIKEIVNLVASDLGLEVLWTECWHLKGDTSGTTEARLRQTFLRATSQGPCILALENVHCLAKVFIETFVPFSIVLKAEMCI